MHALVIAGYVFGVTFLAAVYVVGRVLASFSHTLGAMDEDR